MKLPKSGTVIWAIAKVTAAEILRDRIIYNVGFFSLLLVGSSFLAARLSFLAPDRIVVDVGLAATDLALTIMAILLGAQGAIREVEQRTAWVALARPITRHQFVIGKWLGVFLILALNALLLSAALYAVLYTQVDEPGQMLRVALPVGLFFLFLQSGIVSALSLFFASFLTYSLTIGIMIGALLVGRSVSELRLVAAQSGDLVGVPEVLRAIASSIPNFELFHLGSTVTYDFPIRAGTVAVTLLYFVVWSALPLMGAGFTLGRRERS